MYTNRCLFKEIIEHYFGRLPIFAVSWGFSRVSSEWGFSRVSTNMSAGYRMRATLNSYYFCLRRCTTIYKLLRYNNYGPNAHERCYFKLKFVLSITMSQTTFHAHAQLMGFFYGGTFFVENTPF